MIRAFVAVPIESQVIDRISAALAELKMLGLGVRWTPAANIHLTLKFLGDIDETCVDRIAGALEHPLQLFPRFTINAKGLGVFPDLRRPRVLWVGLIGAQLAALVSVVELNLQRLGFAAEQRTFTPHLTIGRWRQSDRAPKTLGHLLESWKDYPFGATGVNEVILFRSVLNSAGAAHIRLKTMTLKIGDLTD